VTLRSVKHSTIVVERKLPASPVRAFAAWANPDERRMWDVPGEGWIIAEHAHDFRVGGQERTRFGPPDAPDYVSVGLFLDIERDRRIVSAGTMHFRDTRTSSTLCTVEFYPDGQDTQLVLTDQSAFYGEESPEIRQSGWGKILDRLIQFLKEGTAK
jgi:uncharacterized protein YndB with AHSA1/START domain